MTTSFITKKRIAKSLRTLMAQTEFEKISIVEIMEQTGIRRQTFYSHFVDKYDLLNWIFVTDLEEQIQDNLTYVSGDSLLLQLLDFFAMNQAFYRKLFLLEGQNNFSDYFFDYCHQLVEKMISDTPASQAYKWSSDEYNFFVAYQAAAISFLIRKNILSGDMDCRGLSKKIRQALHRGLVGWRVD